ncbi:protein of unknown function [Micropruina glycogenica]|uniref:Uncharacterized protein n=1 Tax=Micropruina glycogenica TaxID=75385 RepID=A0A2N9JLV5_9ACTN|nr:protein of unknown function [Micropruina glycogenica]
MVTAAVQVRAEAAGSASLWLSVLESPYAPRVRGFDRLNGGRGLLRAARLKNATDTLNTRCSGSCAPQPACVGSSPVTTVKLHRCESPSSKGPER